MNISKTVRDRATSSKFLTHRVVQENPMQRGKFSIFTTFGGHLGFYISEMVRVRAILSEFLTRRIVLEYPVPRRKISIFTAFGGHLGV